MTLHISSTNNLRIKQLISLEKPRERRIQGRFTVEGIREISLAQAAAYRIKCLYICESIYRSDSNYPIDFDRQECVTIDEEVYAKVAYREGSGGVIAEIEAKSNSLVELPKIEIPLYLILDQIEKPGNIGALLRTADAAGIDGVLICDGQTDVYNPNLIRSSIGTVFTVPIAVCKREELIKWLKAHQIAVFAAALSASKPYHEVDYTKACGILLGSESQGLGEDWLNASTSNILIPMRGKIDSMNVSNAGAIIMFEATRQRSAIYAK